jgi:eukaryotic-like serine/threonine-protein kinase
VIGQKINNYELKRLLGEGGMGAVYVAEHPMLGRKVAIKVLRRELVRDKEHVARFINEARATDAIAHPNIVQVLDVGQLPDELPYIVMELLQGQTLSARMQASAPLPLATALAIAGQAASAIAAAHAVGVVHRDLKPDNLFLVPGTLPGATQLPNERTGPDRVKVLDFGIAKLKPELGGGDMKTKTGAVMGTPAYMSPEQCLGRSGEVDHRTDVYALGVILFEMLCGVTPFQGEGFGEVLVKHVTEPPPDPRSINPAIPVSIERLILRAMAKRKEDRWDTMLAFEQAIAAGLAAPRETTPSAVVFATRPGATPTRSTATTLSTATGALESLSSELDELRPAKSRRGLIGVALVGAAAVVAGLFWLPGRTTTTTTKIPASPGSAQAPVATTPAPAAAPAAAAPASPPSASPRPQVEKSSEKPAEKPSPPARADLSRPARPKAVKTNKSAAPTPRPLPGTRPPALTQPTYSPPAYSPPPQPALEPLPPPPPPPPAPQRMEKL